MERRPYDNSQDDTIVIDQCAQDATPHDLYVKQYADGLLQVDGIGVVGRWVWYGNYCTRAMAVEAARQLMGIRTVRSVMVERT